MESAHETVKKAKILLSILIPNIDECTCPLNGLARHELPLSPARPAKAKRRVGQ